MPDLSFNLTLPDHLAKALVNGVPTADLDAAVKVIKEQVRPVLDCGDDSLPRPRGARVLERGDVPPPPLTPGLSRPEIQGHVFPGLAKR